MIKLYQLKRLLKDRNFILILSLILGLMFPQAAKWTERLFLPILMFVMTISMTNISGSIFQSPRKWLKPIVISLAINYIVLGGSMILLAYLMNLPYSYLVGFVVLASAPPAIAVIPFSNFLGGDNDYSLIGFTACYIGAFFFTPLIMSTFLGSQPGFQIRIFTLLTELIIIPFLLSRILVKYGIDKRIASVKGSLVNWSFFVIMYTIVGLNNEVFLREPISLSSLALVAISTTFILGYIVEKISKSAGIESNKTVSIVLLGTQKNSGFAAGIALTLFSVETTVPSTLTTIFMLLYVIFLDLRTNLK